MEEQEGDIEWVLEYLHLEYGEKAGDENALKASDLVYVGEYVIDGIPCQYWSYPTSDEPMWVIIENTLKEYIPRQLIEKNRRLE